MSSAIRVRIPATIATSGPNRICLQQPTSFIFAKKKVRYQNHHHHRRHPHPGSLSQNSFRPTQSLLQPAHPHPRPNRFNALHSSHLHNHNHSRHYPPQRYLLPRHLHTSSTATTTPQQPPPSTTSPPSTSLSVQYSSLSSSQWSGS